MNKAHGSLMIPKFLGNCRRHSLILRYRMLYKYSIKNSNFLLPDQTPYFLNGTERTFLYVSLFINLVEAISQETKTSSIKNCR